MSIRSSLLALVLAAATLPAQDSTFVIRGARVFDGTQLLGEQDVLVRGGKIAALGRRPWRRQGLSRDVDRAESGHNAADAHFPVDGGLKAAHLPARGLRHRRKDLVMLIVAAAPAPWAFELFVDGVKIR